MESARAAFGDFGAESTPAPAMCIESACARFTLSVRVIGAGARGGAGFRGTGIDPVAH